MTDLEKTKQLLSELGVEFTEAPYPDASCVICCTAGTRKVEGYPGFFTTFLFTTEGRFINMGAWE